MNISLFCIHCWVIIVYTGNMLRVDFSVYGFMQVLECVFLNKKVSTIFNLPGGGAALKVFKQQNNMMRTS